jgi:hypothetical protein
MSLLNSESAISDAAPKAKALRRTLIALALLTIASVVAHLYVKSQVYYPVVRLELPGGLKIAAVLPETKERKACGDSNDRFLAPFKQSCKECKVAMARCERQLDGLELAMREGTQVAYPMVIASEARLVVLGPSEKAKAGCKFLAASMVARGLRSAVCVDLTIPPKS